MKQVCIINGGTTYDSHDDFLKHLVELELDYSRLLYRPRWYNWLGETLKDFDVLLPSMPNSTDAQYEEWSIYFTKIVPFLHENVILIGHSLGGIFLAKYLNSYPAVRVDKLILIAAPYDDETNESLGSFRLPTDMSHLSQVANEYHLFQSKDDPIVPFAEAKKYLALLPRATLHQFEDRQHFNTPTLPELLDIIKNSTK